MLYANSDDFLHSWDERFHALVARNIIEDPFAPKLHLDDPVNVDPYGWTDSKIWLHKQPVFLWQIALSIYFFGENMVALRLPSIIMQLMMALMIFKIAKNLGESDFVALGTGILLLASRYMIEMSVGVVGMDHNDVAFSFYLLLSYMLFSEFINGKRNKWLLAAGIGFFSGLAVMNKWLIGWIIYGSWFVWIIWPGIRSGNFKTNFQFIAFSFLVHICTFLPWQVYTFWRFPDYALAAQNFNARHITDVLDGHYGDIFYYVRIFYHQYSLLLFAMLVIGIPIMWRTLVRPKLFIVIGLPVIAYYLFFSLVVTTKGGNYVSYLQPMIYLIGMMAVSRFSAWLSYYTGIPEKLIGITSLIVLCISINQPIKMYNYHVSDKGQYYFNEENRVAKKNNTIVYKSLAGKFSETDIIFNMPDFENIDCMYFTGCNAYHFIPEISTCDSLIHEGYELYFFENSGERIFEYELKAGMHVLPFSLQQ